MKNNSNSEESSEENIRLVESVNKWKEGYVGNDKSKSQLIEKGILCYF